MVRATSERPISAFLLAPGSMERRESGKLREDPDGARNFCFKKKVVLKHIFNLVKRKSGILFQDNLKRNNSLK